MAVPRRGAAAEDGGGAAGSASAEAAWLDSVASEECHYAVLGVSEAAPGPEVLRAFRAASRRCHPDARRAPGLEGAATRAMARVNEAHAVLADPERRRQYDATLRAAGAGAAAVLAAEEVDLAEFGEAFWDPDAGGTWAWSKPCRCGGAYVVAERDLDAAAAAGDACVAVPCGGCSLHLAVSFAAADAA